MFNFGPTKDKVKEVEEWLQKEFSQIRTGRASPSILDSVQVQAYGSRMQLRELASVLVEDPRTIRVEPWDKSQGKEIEKAVIASNLGLSVNVDDKGLRIIFPELTSERREQFVKVAKQKLEEARISLRSIRDKVWDEIQAKEKQGGMGEDEKFRLKDDLQKIVDDTNTKLDELLERKVLEISN
ncbi:MAG TPA: ribosome recycling factor [Candidatus Paceibacterota bacterium]